MKPTRWIGVLAFLLVPGCSGLVQGVNTLPKELGKSLAAATKMVVDQGVLDQFTVDAEGDFINPGLETYVTIKFASGVRLQGVTGSIAQGIGGKGTKLPKDVRASLTRQLELPISDEQRGAILEILGWNRQPAPGG